MSSIHFTPRKKKEKKLNQKKKEKKTKIKPSKKSLIFPKNFFKLKH